MNFGTHGIQVTRSGTFQIGAVDRVSQKEILREEGSPSLDHRWEFDHLPTTPRKNPA